MNYESMTDDELISLIEKEYGKDWTPKDIDPKSELFKEYTKRVSTGI